MKKLVGVMFLTLVAVFSSLLAQGGPAPGQGFYEDCQGTCAALGGVSATQCWQNLHNERHIGDQQQCSNYGTDNHPSSSTGLTTNGQGRCDMVWLVGSLVSAESHIDCHQDTCTISGKIKCGTGPSDPYQISCTNEDGKAPTAEATRGNASCAGGNSSATTNYMSVSCNEGIGELVYFWF